MMRFVSDLTRPYGVCAIASPNSNTVGATGMRVAYRVPVMLDGPEIDSHVIDWNRFLPRFQQFKAQEDQNRRRHRFARESRFLSPPAPSCDRIRGSRAVIWRIKAGLVTSCP